MLKNIREISSLVISLVKTLISRKNCSFFCNNSDRVFDDFSKLCPAQSTYLWIHFHEKTLRFVQKAFSYLVEAVKTSSRRQQDQIT